VESGTTSNGFSECTAANIAFTHKHYPRDATPIDLAEVSISPEPILDPIAGVVDQTHLATKPIMDGGKGFGT
jgi:hypothetical protein